MIKVSIIVPVYNVEKYLQKCLDSLIKQTLEEIEIIVVNDGTKDNSQVIIDEYAKKDKRIKPFIKENGGLSDARNYGIRKATGQYIGFVDSDDYVSHDMYAEMYQKAISNNFDLVVSDLYYVFPNKQKECKSGINFDLNTKEAIKDQMINIYPTAWNKIYKKSLIEKFQFKKGVWYEDVEFIYRILPFVEKIGVVSEPFYYYVQRAGAITKTFNSKVFDYVDNWNGIIEFYQEKDLFNLYKDELEYSYVRYLYATMFKCLIKIKDREKYKEGLKNILENVSEKFPNYRENKYLKKSTLKNIYLLNFNKYMANFIRFFRH